MARRWSKKESRSLLLGAGAFGIGWLRKKTGPSYDWKNAPKHRSYRAVISRARRMGLGGFTRGTRSLAKLCRETGYDRTQLLRAMTALNQKWKRTGSHGCFLITDDQIDELLEWLKHDFWAKSKHLYSCCWCSGVKRPHLMLGLCNHCFWKYRKMCLALRVPSGVKQQKGLVVRLRSMRIQPQERKFLERVAWRLGRKLALERSQLEWLSILIPGEWNADRNTRG